MMPVLSKERHKSLIKQLNDRIFMLQEAVKARPLANSSEGANGRGTWLHPESMSATVGSDVDIRLAVNDFKGILAELAKLK